MKAGIPGQSQYASFPLAAGDLERYSLGVHPVSCLNILLKVEILEKPA